MTNRILKDISVLYELSLAVGQSDDLIQNCDKFIKVLLKRKNIYYASVWINEDFFTNQTIIYPRFQGCNDYIIVGEAIILMKLIVV